MPPNDKDINTWESQRLDMQEFYRRKQQAMEGQRNAMMVRARRIDIDKTWVDEAPAFPPGVWDRVKQDMSRILMERDYGLDKPKKKTAKEMTAKALIEASEKINALEEILTRIQKEPLILYQIDRISKDRKHAFVTKQDTEIRIEACPKLEQYDEVLLHPKSFQIVEHLGKPPLVASRFTQDNPPNISWDDIGGLEEAKRDMIEAVEMPHRNQKLFKHYHKKPIKGILLSGPPGCGKTMLGKAAATCLSHIYDKETTRTGFLYVKGPEILDQFVGQTEKCIRDLFQDAQRHQEENGYPAIIFIDEADSILAARGTSTIGLGNTIVPQFLTEMDGLSPSSAIVIIATNRPDILDPAIVRDGRIDRKVKVTRPTRDSALAILLSNLKGIPLHSREKLTTEQYAVALRDAFFRPDRVIRRGEPLSSIVNGAMLANCINIAVSYAVHRDLAHKTFTGLTLEDGIEAIGRLQRSSNSIRHDLEVDQ